MTFKVQDKLCATCIYRADLGWILRISKGKSAIRTSDSVPFAYAITRKPLAVEASGTLTKMIFRWGRSRSVWALSSSSPRIISWRMQNENFFEHAYFRGGSRLSRLFRKPSRKYLADAMRKSIVAIAAALAIVPCGAYVKPHHPAAEDCLVNFHKNGKKYCMTDAQEKAMLGKMSADAKADSEANLKNCTREIADAKIIGGWIKGIKPNEEDCRPFAEQAKAAIDARPAANDASLHHA